MRPFTSTISLEEARAVLEAAATPLEAVEAAPLDALSGRVLAEDLVASADVPPFARAMMDGYAVRATDTTGATPGTPRELVVVGRVFTGEVLTREIAPGECAEIATGAPAPRGSDAVVMVEDTAPGADGGRVHVRAAVAPGQHIGGAGADVATGQVVLRRGEVLLPARVGVVAALGLTEARVFVRPRVALVSTGNELVAPGRPLGPGQIYDVNRSTLAAVVAAHGGVPIALDVAADTLAALDEALNRALTTCEVVLFSGGSSVGDRDLVLDAIRARGEVVFHGIATRPGKPTAFGRIGRVPVFGMPGNPSSCLTNAYVLLVPFVRTLAHLPPYEPRTVRVPLARRVNSSVGRHQFYTVRLVGEYAEPAFKASGDITSIAHADGYVEIPSDVTVIEAGTPVKVTLF